MDVGLLPEMQTYQEAAAVVSELTAEIEKHEKAILECRKKLAPAENALAQAQSELLRGVREADL